ncbi:MAG: cytochrome c-type biogenesis protein CcmH [Gemmatimonadota bacterium]
MKRGHSVLRRSVILAVGLLWALPMTAWAQTQAPALDSTAVDAAAAEIASELRCPVCRNQSVLESSADVARDMHRLIQEKLAAGESPEAVKEYFVGKYGEWVLLKPEARGINLLVYLLPLTLIVVALLVLQGRIRSWVAAGTASRAGTFPLAAEVPGAADSTSGPESEPSGTSADVSARISGENERWLEEALRE